MTNDEIRPRPNGTGFMTKEAGCTGRLIMEKFLTLNIERRKKTGS